MTRRGHCRAIAWAGLALASAAGCAGAPAFTRDLVPNAAVRQSAKSPPAAEEQTAPPAKPQPVVQAAAREPVDTPLPAPRPLPPEPACAGGACPAPLDGLLPPANPLPGPTAAGCLLNLAPHETALERAVELAKRLGVAEVERQALAARILQLEVAVEARDKLLADSAREVEQATAEMSATREDFQSLRRELSAMSARLRQSEKADVESMKAMLASLEKLLDPPAAKGPAK